VKEIGKFIRQLLICNLFNASALLSYFTFLVVKAKTWCFIHRSSRQFEAHNSEWTKLKRG
jgi:hypothetical protein